MVNNTLAETPAKVTVTLTRQNQNECKDAIFDLTWRAGQNDLHYQGFVTAE